MQAGGEKAGASFDDMAALIDPEAVTHQSPDPPWDGDYRSHAGWLEFFANVIVHFETLEVSDPMVVGTGDTVMTRATLKTRSRATGVELTRPYQLRNYYHGAWRPSYERWVGMLAGQYAGPEGDIVRDAQARLSDMIQTQPVAADLLRLRMQASSSSASVAPPFSAPTPPGLRCGLQEPSTRSGRG